MASVAGLGVIIIIRVLGPWLCTRPGADTPPPGALAASRGMALSSAGENTGTPQRLRDRLGLAQR